MGSGSSLKQRNSFSYLPTLLQLWIVVDDAFPLFLISALPVSLMRTYICFIADKMTNILKGFDGGPEGKEVSTEN